MRQSCLNKLKISCETLESKEGIQLTCSTENELRIVLFACKLTIDLFVLVDEKLDKLQEKIKILEEMNSKVAMKIDKIKTEQKNVQDSERQLDQVRLDDRQVTNT